MLWFLLPSRLILFAFFQSIIAVVFTISGNETPWHTSESWWPFSVLFTNIIIIIILFYLYKNEKTAYFKEIKFIKQDWGKDFLLALLLFIIMLPIAIFPNTIIANALWGNAETANNLLIRPLPFWAIILSILFPITHIFAELPLYFGYIMPRIQKILNNVWAPLIITSGFLALQHISLPLIFNCKFIVWRGLMFFPFALFIGLCIKLRPRLLPYFMIGHGIIDAMVIILIATTK